MKNNIEFFLDPDGVLVKDSNGVHMMDENSDRDLIIYMNDKIKNDYPDTFRYLMKSYEKAVSNKRYYEYLIARRFAKCNFSKSDKSIMDIDEDGNFNIEEPTCPLGCECSGFKIVCYCKKSDSLTDREREILTKYANGMDEIDIANELYISKCTVHNTLSRAYSKIGVRSKIDAYKFLNNK